jgi:uncharacterized protein YjiS (DUF1127 family)
MAAAATAWREFWLYLCGSDHSRIRQLEHLRTLEKRLLCDIGLAGDQAPPLQFQPSMRATDRSR